MYIIRVSKKKGNEGKYNIVSYEPSPYKSINDLSIQITIVIFLYNFVKKKEIN